MGWDMGSIWGYWAILAVFGPIWLYLALMPVLGPLRVHLLALRFGSGVQVPDPGSQVSVPGVAGQGVKWPDYGVRWPLGAYGNLVNSPN